jgi:hypothetical protein
VKPTDINNPRGGGQVRDLLRDRKCRALQKCDGVTFGIAAIQDAEDESIILTMVSGSGFSNSEHKLQAVCVVIPVTPAQYRDLGTEPCFYTGEMCKSRIREKSGWAFLPWFSFIRHQEHYPTNADMQVNMSTMQKSQNTMLDILKQHTALDCYVKQFLPLDDTLYESFGTNVVLPNGSQVKTDGLILMPRGMTPYRLTHPCASSIGRIDEQENLYIFGLSQGTSKHKFDSICPTCEEKTHKIGNKDYDCLPPSVDSIAGEPEVVAAIVAYMRETGTTECVVEGELRLNADSTVTYLLDGVRKDRETSNSLKTFHTVLELCKMDYKLLLSPEQRW